MIHELKCWPLYFHDILERGKRFEIRKKDRKFFVGDTLHLREWSPRPTEDYTGETLDVQVVGIWIDMPGVDPEYVVMSIKPVTEEEDVAP
jgi:hypothetical protein